METKVENEYDKIALRVTAFNDIGKSHGLCQNFNKFLFSRLSYFSKHSAQFSYNFVIQEEEVTMKTLFQSRTRKRERETGWSFLILACLMGT